MGRLFFSCARGLSPEIPSREEAAEPFPVQCFSALLFCSAHFCDMCLGRAVAQDRPACRTHSPTLSIDVAHCNNCTLVLWVVPPCPSCPGRRKSHPRPCLQLRRPQPTRPRASRRFVPPTGAFHLEVPRSQSFSISLFAARSECALGPTPARTSPSTHPSHTHHVRSLQHSLRTCRQQAPHGDFNVWRRLPAPPTTLSLPLPRKTSPARSKP